MWLYVKMLEYPINIKKKDVKMAGLITSQYGGPQGELSAAIRYLNQRFTMPDDYGKAVLTDIGTEELAHVEMIQTMIAQLTEGATAEDYQEAGLAPNYIEHGKDLFPESSGGLPNSATYISSVGEVIANIVEDMAAEQKAKAIYEHLIELATDEAVIQPLIFLREREIIHYQRFSELLEHYKEMGYQ